MLCFCYSLILCDIIENIPTRRLTKQKMMTINDIVHSQLFLYADCRKIILPVILKQVKVLFEVNDEVREGFYCLRALKNQTNKCTMIKIDHHVNKTSGMCFLHILKRSLQFFRQNQK